MQDQKWRGVPVQEAEVVASVRSIQTDYHRALGTALDRLCELLPEAGVEQMEIPIDAAGEIDRYEALFPMAAALLRIGAGRLAPGEGASHNTCVSEQAVEAVLAELASLLSD